MSCGPCIRQGLDGGEAERAEGGVREEAIADEDKEALPRSAGKHHGGSEEVLGSCKPVTEVEEKGAEAEVERNMREGGGTHQGCERHCQWETVQESGCPWFTGPENAAACLMCLLPHLYPQMEVIRRLKMETRAGVKLCPGSLSQNSQESLTSKCDCQGHL